jgi:transcriptional regulator with XRE-family HTH domain
MPRRFKREVSRRRHFIAEWRAAKGMTATALSKRVNLSKSQISKIERGIEPYTQDTLEAIAEALGEHPACLISHEPHEAGPIAILRSIPPGPRRERVMRILRAAVENGDT